MPSSDTQFKAGVSGNPGGRPKAARAVAAKIRLNTKEGLELVDFHRGRMNDPEEKYENRKTSCDWLAQWGFGSPDPAEEDEVTGGRVLPFGLSSLSPPPEGE